MMEENMAKPIVSRDAVFEICSIMVKEGVEPSILTIQARLGGGSYTTVKRFLDEWRKTQSENPAATLDIPPEVSLKGDELSRVIWSTATQLAEKNVQNVKEQALAEASNARQELANALNELQRLERIEVDQTQALEEKTHHIRELELKVATLEVEAKRVAELQSELDTLRASFARAEQEARSLREQAEKANAVQSSLTELQTKVEALIAGQRKEKS
jgi:DNA repair exonuclease SbcCD ATPase subunit